MDVSHPANPVPVGTYDTADAASDVALAGKVAYVATGNVPIGQAGPAVNQDAGLLVLDCTDPAHPVRLGKYQTATTAVRVTLSGSQAYLLSLVSGY